MSNSQNFTGRPVKAVIDRSAFKHNIQVVQTLAPNSKVLVVIKADAYGHGLIEMARVVDELSGLAVATAEEAQLLIEAGIKNTIWVLEGPFSVQCLALSTLHPIVWVLHSAWQLPLFGTFQSEKSFNVCLKIDTGMHRLGFPLDSVAEALKEINKLECIHLQACMSHFLSSDQENSDLVSQQAALFNDVLSANALESLPQTLANSGAILFYPETHCEWVRPGIMLYGGMPDPSQLAQDRHLRPVMRFESAVMSLRHILKGEPVGYGAAWVAERDSVIAIVAGGYGDGYPRQAPNGTPLVVAGQIASLAGRVSMDMLAIDVTDLKGVKVGDPVEFWGKYVSVDQVAELSGTISYELLTGVTARVPRVYK